ncbi:hypothetical protein HanHA300_Chr01g0036521 [Helianthus annuus]|nr:hypothetical protein HanHA300_Chr01g0036521 [Helianthus annuus]KAJ0625018.1 hypothetical protein HanIR_Chr01g0049281 [Helianthus annuus]KAJ0784989.1 hypothetical protein HanLR1_Chr01g0037811 [Helianthus annuus]KAJ0794251.1 hypothetical protein HanOQP8_Chr01g0037931 [Helianthus annuus]KAJ0958906.1 hypothetical protein HanPSC8_Chr01g0044061 [Helianthus annuus]
MWDCTFEFDGTLGVWINWDVSAALTGYFYVVGRLCHFYTRCGLVTLYHPGAVVVRLSVISL